MNDIDKLRQEFLKQAHGGGPQPIYDAQVTEVDEEAYSCDVLLDSEIPVYGVRLRAVVSNNQSIDVLPAVDASVLIGKLSDDDYVVLAADQITSYRVTIGPTQFKITADGLLLQKQDETLNKILTDLVQGLLSVAATKDVPGITQLLTRINNLLK